MLLYLLGYLGVGLLAVFTLAILHLSTAIKRGYDIDVMTDVMRNLNGDSNLIGCIYGWFIWPIRTVQFILDLDKLYEAYDQYAKESK